MKIRQGFVSNSSSSSFVILGFFGEKENTGKYESIYVEHEKSDYITGLVLADGDPYDGYFEGEFGNIPEEINEIADFFNKDKSEIKIHIGVRPS